MKLTIRETEELNKLRLAKACMAHGDVRYYLNGILFNFDRENKAVRVVGTDGHRLATDIIRVCDDDWDVPEWAGDEVILGMKKADKIPVRAEAVTLELFEGSASGALSCFDKNGKTMKIIGVKKIEGRYPDWERVIPSEPLYPAKDPAFDATLLYEIASAPVGRSYQAVQLKVEKNSTGAYAVTLAGYGSDDTKIVLMGCRM